MTHMCIHATYILDKYVAYIYHFNRIFVSGTYMAIIWEVEVAVGTLWHIYAKMLGLCGHAAWWQCNQFGNEISCHLISIQFDNKLIGNQ